MLQGPLAKCTFKMTYSGVEEHPVWDQEIPAVFLDSNLSTLIMYNGPEPWTGAPVDRLHPGFPNK